MTTAPTVLVPLAALLLVASGTSPPTSPRAAPPTSVGVVAHDVARPAALGALAPRPGAAATSPQLLKTPSTSTSPVVLPRGRWVWPLAPRPAVARPFAAPTSRYAAGHRGVDLAAHQGQPVLAVDAGTVTHVGVIAGRGTVSVLHTSGLRSTYEPVVAAVHRGDVVARGDPLGTVSDVAGHCTPQTCLHLGAVRGRTYVDPLQLLGIRRVRLLPLE